MTNTNTFNMLVGLAGSGKTTLSKKLINGKDNILYLSSDDLRVELYGDVNDQEHNGELFQEMNKRAVQAIKDGKDVVYDATNLSRKKRRGILQQLPKYTNKVAHVLVMPIDNVLYQNSKRERVVPEGAIKRMYNNFQIPVYGEGWDKIILKTPTYFYNNEIFHTLSEIEKEITTNVNDYGIMMYLSQRFDEFCDIYELPHDSKWHNFSVSRHVYYVYKHVLDNYETEDKREKLIMLWSALLHDTGKAETKTFENRKRQIGRYAHFYGHEYVSSQLAVNLLRSLGYEYDFIYEVATLCQFHMYLLDEKANKDKLKKLVGEKTFKQLEFLRDADTLAH